jgi:hypothetical protein
MEDRLSWLADNGHDCNYVTISIKYQAMLHNSGEPGFTVQGPSSSLSLADI